MKSNTFIFILLSIGFITTALSQFGPKQIITTDANGIGLVVVQDIDGDGFKDVIGALRLSDQLVWYKNISGTGVFGQKEVIALLDQTMDVVTSDIDGDNDFDIVGTSFSEDTIMWYENLSGNGIFSSGSEVVNNPLDFAFETKASDIDGDGDMDIVSSSDTFDDIFWFENLDGIGTFSARKTVGLFGNNGRDIAIADMDGDGDMDVVASSSNTETLSWYRNIDGQGSFSEFIEILPSGSATTGLFITDIDGDMDNDILIATLGQNEVSWLENLDGLGTFGSKNSITTNAMFVLSVFGADLDNDGDIDIISGSSQDNKVAWYENVDGQGAFGSQQVLTTSAIAVRSVYAADLDNDGDMDILAGSQNDDTIAWFENLTILGVNEQDVPEIRVYPNPAKTVLYIDATMQIIDAVIVYDIQGKQVLEATNIAEGLPIASLETGVYFVSLLSRGQTFVHQFIKE
jgi:hypothetical protein